MSMGSRSDATPLGVTAILAGQVGQPCISLSHLFAQVTLAAGTVGQVGHLLSTTSGSQPSRTGPGHFVRVRCPWVPHARPDGQESHLPSMATGSVP